MSLALHILYQIYQGIVFHLTPLWFFFYFWSISKWRFHIQANKLIYINIECLGNEDLMRGHQFLTPYGKWDNIDLRCLYNLSGRVESVIFILTRVHTNTCNMIYVSGSYVIFIFAGVIVVVTIIWMIIDFCDKFSISIATIFLYWYIWLAISTLMLVAMSVIIESLVLLIHVLVMGVIIVLWLNGGAM